MRFLSTFQKLPTENSLRPLPQIEAGITFKIRAFQGTGKSRVRDPVRCLKTHTSSVSK